MSGLLSSNNQSMQAHVD